MTQTRTARFLLVILVVLALFLAAPTAAQDKSVVWERFDVDLAVQPDGSFIVTETQTIRFNGGPFTYGFRNIAIRYLEDIIDIEIWEGERAYAVSDSEEPGTYSITRTSSSVNLRWYFFEPVSDDTRTFIIRYRVLGGLRYYDEGDQIWWQAVYGDRPAEVKASVVTLSVPAPAEITKLDTYFGSAEIELLDPQHARFTATKPLPSGRILEVRAQFTHGVVAGSPAPWQIQADEEAAQREQERARQEAYDRNVRPYVNLLALFCGLGLILLAPVALFLIWYGRGRDARTDFVADYLPEPPSNLPPAMVGALVDERADMEDILSTIVDLARRGYIEIEEEKPNVDRPDFATPPSDFVYRRIRDADEHLRKYERMLLKALFRGRETRRLSELKAQFYKHLENIGQALYEELVSEGYFIANPHRVRRRWAILGAAALAFACVGCIALASLVRYGEMLILLPVGPILFGLGLIVISRFMPKKTAKGAEASEAWKAFRRYLKDIDKYTDLPRATELFERYLPYAIAFGLDKTYINRWAKVEETPIPRWYRPYPRPIYTAGTPGGHTASAAPRSAGAEIPSLSEASRRMSAGLAGMSAGLTSMLSSAATTLSSKPHSSSGGGWSSSSGSFGGGWSGGGSFGGGGGGGGSGGFG
ncbi:MAG: DUF2207 domain-containing protein [Chloroflexi bacterium]|nr:DUF2207 domain-containing protein [Chloroflexota bacterium]